MEGRADDERQKEDKERMMADDSPGCPWRRAVIEGNMSFPSHYSPISHSAHTQPSSHMHTHTHTYTHRHRDTHTPEGRKNKGEKLLKTYQQDSSPFSKDFIYLSP